jgi:hypothetical protein
MSSRNAPQHKGANVVGVPTTYTPAACPCCTRDMDEVEYLVHGYDELYYVCEACDLRLAEDSYRALADDAEAEGAADAD